MLQTQAKNIPNDATEQLLKKALTLTQMGDYTRAIDDFAIVLELRPDCLEAWSEKASAYMNLGQYESAIGCLDKALMAHPTSPFLVYQRGWIAGRGV